METKVIVKSRGVFAVVVDEPKASLQLADFIDDQGYYEVSEVRLNRKAKLNLVIFRRRLITQDYSDERVITTMEELIDIFNAAHHDSVL